MSWHLDIISSIIIFYKAVVSTLAVRMTELRKFLKYLWFLSLTMHTNVEPDFANKNMGYSVKSEF